MKREIKKQLLNMLQDISCAYEDGEDRFRTAWSDMHRYISGLETDLDGVDKRDMILFGEPYSSDKYEDGIRRFDDLNWKKLNELIEKGVLDINKRNDSNSFNKIYEYLSYHHLLKCCGYVCAPDNYEADEMVVIEGIDYNGTVTMEMFIDFVGMFRDADEFAAGVNRLHCRYV